MMFEVRSGEALAEISSLPTNSGRTEAVVVRLVDYYVSPLFKAALQVWTAAAADEALRKRIVPLKAKFGREVHRMAIAALGVDDNDPITHHLVQATLDLARGLALADVLTDDSVRREKVVRAWADTMATACRPYESVAHGAKGGQTAPRS